jgi:hypothetical protein
MRALSTAARSGGGTLNEASAPAKEVEEAAEEEEEVMNPEHRCS